MLEYLNEILIKNNFVPIRPTSVPANNDITSRLIKSLNYQVGSLTKPATKPNDGKALLTSETKPLTITPLCSSSKENYDEIPATAVTLDVASSNSRLRN